MKKVLIFSLLFSNVFMLSSCKDNNQNDGNSASDNSDIDIFLALVLRQDFYLDDIHYVMNTDVELNSSSKYKLIGYFVNFSDLQYWKSIDHNANFVYAVEEGNNLVNRDNDDNFKNRFALYSLEIINAIGVSANFESSLFVYEKVE